MKYLIGSGYYNGENSGSDWFFKNIWFPRADKLFHSPLPPERAVIMANGDSQIPYYAAVGKFDRISLNGNLGHIHHLLNPECPKKNNYLCGWSAIFIALAMIAYNDECDFVFLEQDALAFGNWIEQAYADMGDGDFVFGRKMKSEPWQPCSQSLFIIRHRFIPKMIAQYLSLGTDADKDNLPEHKFCKIEEMNPAGVVRRLSFGCERERPMPIGSNAWFVQKLTPEELLYLKALNLVSFDALPDRIGKFSND
jgi:hypothetical protein